MPYQHKYKCRKCGFFIIESNSIQPPPEQQHLFFRDYTLIREKIPIWGTLAIRGNRNRNTCQFYVQYVETKPVGPVVEIDRRLQARNRVIAEGMKYYDRKRRRVRENPPSMLAVMYDTVLQRWFTGRTGTDPIQGNIPLTIWNRIPQQIDAEHYRFGRTCAEVHCLRQAYQQRNSEQRLQEDLNDSVFAAFSPLEGRIRSPCNACTQWITQSGGSAVDH